MEKDKIKAKNAFETVAKTKVVRISLRVNNPCFFSQREKLKEVKASNNNTKIYH